MKEEGIEFVVNADVGKNVSAAKILKEYDRVVLACGASNARDVKVPGRDANGIFFAVDFLTRVTKSLVNSDLKDGKFINVKNKRVLVIGGGDTGNDCIGTVLRLGCKSVTQLEINPQPPVQRAENNPWPEWPRVLKTDYGQQEATVLFGKDPRLFQTTVKEFIKDENGNLKKAVLINLESKVDPKTGRSMMVPVEGTEKEIPVDCALIAAGFQGSESYVTNAFGVKVNERTNVDTVPGEFQTSVDKVFVTGDMHRGQSLVVWAVREGKDAARAVDLSLMGYTNL